MYNCRGIISYVILIRFCFVVALTLVEFIVNVGGCPGYLVETEA